MSYTPIEGVLDASWVGSASYAPPVTIVVGDWREGFASVYPAGFRSSEIGTQFITKQQFVDPLGWVSAVYGTALGTLNWQYIPPYAAIDASWVGAFSYTPPVSPFTAIWAVGPPSDDISVYGVGFESSVFGEHLTWWPQFVSPDGLDTARFGWTTAFREGEYPPSHGSLHADWSGSPLYAPHEGWAFALWKVLPEGAVWAYGLDHSRFSSTPHVWNKRQYVKPPGAFTESFGGAELILTAQGASVGGIAPPPQTGPNGDRQIPSPFIDFRIRHLLPGGVAASAPPNPTLTHDIQYLDLAGRGPNPWVTGNARVEYAVRYIEPPFIASNVFGSHNVARIQVVALSGWESSFISENHELDINLQRIFHHSGAVDPTGYGATHVRNQFEVLHPTGWLSQNINFPVIYNLRQVVKAGAYAGSNADPTGWPNYAPFVENLKRFVGAQGWTSAKFSVIGNWIRNAADPLYPGGHDSLTWGADSFVGHYTRYVGPAGWDSFYNTDYSQLYNAAAVIAPTGFAQDAYGRPSQVLNLNRTVQHYNVSDTATYGTAFVAFAVRSLVQRPFNDVPAALPEVRWNPWPIPPAGIDSYRTGGHTVFERFNTLAPKSVNVFSVPRAGEPVVANRNVQLTVGSSPEQTLYGRTAIANAIQYLPAGGGDLLLFSAPVISYKTRTLTIQPIGALAPSTFTKIKNQLPDPPAQQLVLPNGFGFEPESLRFGSVTAKLSTLYPNGIYEGGYGQPVFTRNTLEVARFPFDLLQVGEPQCTTTRFVAPKPVPWPNGKTAADPVGESDLGAHRAKPRLTPHTVYAPNAEEATQQARLNHPASSPHRIDAHLGGGQYSLGSGWPWFGKPTASNFHRSIGPAPSHSSPNDRLAPTVRFGTPKTALRVQYVAPTGIRSLRYGLFMLWGVPQFVNLDTSAGGIDGQALDNPAVDFPPETDLSLKPTGLNSLKCPKPTVDLFNRTLLPSGIAHRGNPESPNPYKTTPWGSTLVGYPRQYYWGGQDFTLWGTARVEYRIRRVYPRGFESLSLADDDFTRYSDRLRFSRRNPADAPVGIGSQVVFGQSTISSAVRTVLGRGVMGYNSGNPTAAARATLAPQGFDSLAIGIVDKWEANKLKPYGDDVSRLGTPKLLHPVRQTSLDDSVVSAPRMAWLLSLSGMPEIGFAGPSVFCPCSCNNRVVTPQGIDASIIPNPAVA